MQDCIRQTAEKLSPDSTPTYEDFEAYMREKEHKHYRHPVMVELRAILDRLEEATEELGVWIDEAKAERFNGGALDELGEATWDDLVTIENVTRNFLSAARGGDELLLPDQPRRELIEAILERARQAREADEPAIAAAK